MTHYDLYYAPNTASFSIHWLLVELERRCGITYTLHLVDFSTSAQKSPEYLALNPQGRVPCLVFEAGGRKAAYAEQIALAQFLVERHPDANLAPPPSDIHGRARFLETMTFIGNSLLPMMRDWVYADKDGEEQYAKGVRLLAKKRLEDAWSLLDRQLEGQKYLGGDDLGAVDILAGALVTWTGGLEKIALNGHERVQEWAKRVQSEPSWEEARRREDGWTYSLKPFEEEYFA